MRVRTLLLDLGAAFVFAALVTAAVSSSTLFRASPDTLAGTSKLTVTAALAAMASFFAFFVAPALSSRAPRPFTEATRHAARLPALFALASLAALLALYHASLLDWTRLLKDWSLSGERVPNAGEVLSASGPLLFVLVLHGVHERGRIRSLAAEKRVLDAEADAVRRAFRRRALIAALAAVATAVILLGALALLSPLATFLPLVPGLTLVGPVLALGLLVFAVTLRLRRAAS